MRQLTLENGLTVILVPFDDPAVVVAYGCHGGYRHDPEDKQGLSHLTEHVVFRGRDWESFARYYEGFCDEFMGETDATSIVFYGRTVRLHAARATSMLSEVVARPSITKVHVRNELERIREEAAEYEESTDHALDKDFFETLGIRWSDRAEVMNGFTAQDVRSLHRRLYVGKNSVLVVAGGFDDEKVEATVNERFSSLRAGVRAELPRLDYTRIRGTIRQRRTEDRKVSFVIGFPTFGFAKNDRIVLGIIRNHLSSRVSSRLSVRLDSIGYGYSSQDSLYFFNDIGYFSIEASVFPEKLLSTLRIIADELSMLRTSLVPSRDLLHAQRNLKVRARIRFGNPSEVALFYTRQWVNLGEIIPLRTYLTLVNTVTRQQIRRVARKIVVNKRLVFVAHGPLKKFRKQDIRNALRLRR